MGGGRFPGDTPSPRSRPSCARNPPPRHRRGHPGGRRAPILRCLRKDPAVAFSTSRTSRSRSTKCVRVFGDRRGQHLRRNDGPVPPAGAGRDLGSRRGHGRWRARGRGMVDDPRGAGIDNVATSGCGRVRRTQGSRATRVRELWRAFLSGWPQVGFGWNGERTKQLRHLREAGRTGSAAAAVDDRRLRPIPAPHGRPTEQTSPFCATSPADDSRSC